MKILNFSQLVEGFDSEYMELFERMNIVEENDSGAIFKGIFETGESLFLMGFLKEMEGEESGFSRNLGKGKWEVTYNIPYIENPPR